MKIGGVTLTGPSEEFLVLPRDPEPIVFRAKAIADMDEFHKLCPDPKPPGKLTKDGWIPDLKDEGFKSVEESHARQRLSYMVIRTLAPSQIEWEQVRLDNPKTWGSWEEELRAGGLTKIEINRVIQLVLDANSLNEDKLVKAREVFQRGRVQVPDESFSPSSAPANTPSGEPAPASA